MGALKRPLAVVGFSMLFTVLCIILSDCTALAVFAVAFAGVCFVISVAFHFRAADTLFAIAIGIAIGALFFLNAEYGRSKAVTFCGENRYIRASVTDEAEYSQKRDRFYVTASVKTVDGEKCKSKIRMSFPASSDGVHNKLKTGDIIEFTGVVYKIGSDSEDVYDSFSAEKTYLGAYSVNILSIREPRLRPLTFYAERLRNTIRNILTDNFSAEVSGLVNSILTGDKSECPYDVYLNIKRSGTAHIMAVSGLHLSVWLSVLFLVWKSSGIMRKLRFAIGIPFIIFFVFLAGFSPSVCRAALMSSLYLTGSLLKENAEPLNTTGFALLCIMCVNPFAVFSVSFQLSFACVLAIILIASPLSEALKTKLKKNVKNKFAFRAGYYLLSSIIITLSVSVATFPISSYHFGYVSLVSPITNLLIVPVCAPLMVVSALFLIFSGVPYIATFFHIATDILGKYMLFVTDGFSSFSFSTVCTDMREKLLWFVGAFAIGILFILKRVNRKRMLKFASVLMVILTAFSLLMIIEKRTDECKIKVINTEVGSASVLIYNGKGILLGVVGDYYFADMLTDVVEAENIDLVAAVPIRESDKEELTYICSDFGIENLLSDGERAELFGVVTVYAVEKGAEITVKGKTVGAFSSDYLQVEKSYDIIIRNDGIITFADGDAVASPGQGHSLTAYISSNRDIRVRREEFWLNLMKKS